MPPSADEIILEFVEQSMHRRAAAVASTTDNDDEGYEDTPKVAARPRIVTLGRRGGAGTHKGYVRVWGPSADPSQGSQCYIVVEMANGAIGIPEPLLPYLPAAQARPSHTPITQHPLGHSAGPNYGRFRFGLAPGAMGSANALVSALIHAVEQAVGSW